MEVCCTGGSVRRKSGLCSACGLALSAVMLMSGGALHASHRGFAPCPTADRPSVWQDPGGEVIVTILSAEVSSDIDSEVLFFTNHADVYGTVEIDGQSFSLPQLGGTDHPHWDEIGRFRARVRQSPVEIRIALREYDSGANLGDDMIDIDPRAGDDDLRLDFDLCSLRLSGDLTGPSQGVLEASGDSASGIYRGTVRFKVELADGRPVSEDDVALAEVDLVQVVHQTKRLIAGKPAVALVRVANNFRTDVSTSVRLEIIGPGGFQVDQTFPIGNLGQAEVRKEYYFAANPIVVPHPTPGDATLYVRARVDPGGALTETLREGDCRRFNDRIDGPDHENGLQWTIVETEKPTLFWTRVGMPLDAPSFTPPAHIDEIRTLGDTFIEAIFPVEQTIDWISPIPVVPPTSSALQFLASVLKVIGIPADALLPFGLVFELNGVSVLLGADRTMGVLPNQDWFRQFSYDTWATKSGLSLGDVAPYAVIFLPVKDRIRGEAPGAALTLPGHELGHTYGLSTDPRLKGPFCSVDWGIFQLICAAAGGLDERSHDDAALSEGNPSTGYWVRRGTEPQALTQLTSAEQCDSHCVMGTNPQSSHLHWGSRRRWIDAADYEHLVRQLKIGPDPEVLYVSGMIDYEDRAHLGPWYRLPEGVADRTELSDDKYSFRFVDEAGELLLEVGLPERWAATELGVPIPVTFFAQKLPFPEGARTVELWNRRSERLIAQRVVSRNRPEVQIVEPPRSVSLVRGEELRLAWRGEDADGDPMEYSVLLDSEASGRTMVAYRLRERFLELDTARLPVGDLALTVVAADGVNTSRSQPLALRIEPDR